MNTVPLWVTIVGFVVPFLGLAGSAVAFVVKLFRDAKERRENRFFEMMQLIDGQGTIATKIAAVYALRDFREHREFLVRFCETQSENITGGDTAVALLKSELKLTAEAMK